MQSNYMLEYLQILVYLVRISPECLKRIVETPKLMLWQTVKIQMKCSISSESALFAKILKKIQGQTYIIIKKFLPVNS